ncbi:MAG: nucleotidyltransferase [Cyclobacteriaceae bacterium]|nr:nucleotidyltransferase [Cyclobacteriaceae bacterium]
MNQDIRWHQRFKNFQQALAQLTKFIEKGDLNEFEEQGLIQSFEYNYELAWNTIKDYYEHQGEVNIQGSRDAIQLAFKRGLLPNGTIWMDMVKSRILSSHTYNRKFAEAVVYDIKQSYYSEFVYLREAFKVLIKEER